MEQLTLVDTGPTLTTIDVLESDLILDKRIQPRVGIDTPTVAAYEALYREGHDLGPLVVFDDGETAYLADGFHRMLAALAAGLPRLPAELHRGTFRDALLYATGCNKHGKQLTNADKRKAVTTLLQDEEWSRWSNNAIAKHCGVSHTFVNALRSSLTTVSSAYGDMETSQPTTRKYVNKHGQQVTMQVDAIGHRNGQTPCANCGRPLTDAESISRGVGPVCACKQPSASAAPARPGPRFRDTGEQTTLDPAQQMQGDAEQARKAAEERAAWQQRECAETVEHLGLLVADYGLEVVETRILAVFLAAHGRPAPVEPSPAQSLSEMFARAWRTLQALDEWLNAAMQQGETAASLVRHYESDIALLQQATVHIGARLSPHSTPAPVETPPQTQAPQTGFTARVWAQLQTYGRKGATGAMVAKALGAPYQKVCKALTRFVTQGKATKKGTTYIYCSPEAV